MFFAPEVGGPTLVAVAGPDRVDVDALDDEDLIAWIDRARAADLE